MKARSLFWKADRCLVKVTKLVSYIPPICLLAVAIIATINIITTKLFHWGVPSVNDWISYFLIPIVYLALAYVQLDQGMVSVDFVSKRFPRIFNEILITLWDLIFSLAAFYISKNMFGLTMEYMQLHKRSSLLAGSFPLWPLALILGVGMLLYGVSTLWIIARRFVPREESSGAETGEGERK